MTEAKKPLDRRAFLKTTGAVALSGALVACGDDKLAGGIDATDALGPDIDDGDTTGGEVGAEIETALDTGPELADEVAAPDAVDTEAGPELPDTGPETTPVTGRMTHLRRDGSSPLDYIEHIVIVEMENRSFDHYFGALSLEEGRTDVEGLRADHHNVDSNGISHYVQPANGLWVLDPDPPHGHGACVDQFDNGQCTGFVRAYEDDVGNDQHLLGQVMSYFQREELPVLYGLADAFTLCDHWHCALLGPTWPNRFYSHAATSGGVWTNIIPLAEPTIYSKALAAGVSYGVYHQSPIYFALTMLDPGIGSYDSKELDDFYNDAANGTLPNITVVEPDYGLNDDHPPHDIRLGQAFVGSIYEALRQSPKWDRTLMLVFYDEHGGFFDHVPPGKAAGESRAAQGFEQLGFRVPGIVAGGLVKRGHIMKTPVEHSSVPGLIARTFGIEHVNARAEQAGDLSDALDLALVEDAKRIPPPAIGPVEVPNARMEAAMRGRFRQEELLAFARERGHRYGTLADKRARTERWVARAEKLGAMRVTRG